MNNVCNIKSLSIDTLGLITSFVGGESLPALRNTCEETENAIAEALSSQEIGPHEDRGIARTIRLHAFGNTQSTQINQSDGIPENSTDLHSETLRFNPRSVIIATEEHFQCFPTPHYQRLQINTDVNNFQSKRE